MAGAEFHEVKDVNREKLFEALRRYEDYPKFVEGMKTAKVDRSKSGQIRASYEVSMMKDVAYTLDLKEEYTPGAEVYRIQWSLVESDSFKKNNGTWELRDAGKGKTDVKYSLEIEFNFSVPGFILNRLVKGSLPSMVEGFCKRAKTL